MSLVHFVIFNLLILSAVIAAGANKDFEDFSINSDKDYFEEDNGQNRIDNLNDDRLDYEPWGMHISFGDPAPNTVVIVWSTWSNLPIDTPSTCNYGISSIDENSKIGKSSSFLSLVTNFTAPTNAQFIHRVNLTDLLPDTVYTYQCGSSMGWSEQFTFRTIRNDTNWSPRLCIYGDLGLTNAISWPRIQERCTSSDIDAILHIGDIAYDLQSENGRIGDEFMQMIQPLAATVPYMTLMGNHEIDVFELIGRFKMPGLPAVQDFIYSFTTGPVRFICVSSEVYYFPFNIYPGVLNLIFWLNDELKKANDERDTIPWVVVAIHRPSYCLVSDSVDCERYSTIIRAGDGKVPGLEDLFYQAGVDLVIAGHEHSYGRFLPLQNYTICSGPGENPYQHPRAVTNIITGSAGNKEGADYVEPALQPWVMSASMENGFGMLDFMNFTHVSFKQIHALNGTVMDEMTLVREYPRQPYSCV